MQKPPFVVQDEMMLVEVEYQLTGAVVMGPDHFLNVGEQYALIDGYPPMKGMHHYPKKVYIFLWCCSRKMKHASLM